MKPAFDIATLNIAWAPILPLIVGTIAAIAVLLVGVHVDDDDSEALGWLSLAGLGVALVMSFAMLGQQEQTLGCSGSTRKRW